MPPRWGVHVLIHQPEGSLGQFLGDSLSESQGSRPRWLRFNFASAWVNQSGAVALEGAMNAFLARGGQIRGTVGLDFMGTTAEGLQTLLGLRSVYPDQMSIFVYKNEWGGSTFHPKVYAFCDEEETLLIVGSNNLTGAGLRTNVECSLLVQGPSQVAPAIQTLQLLEHWQTPSDVVKVLDEALLDSLIQHNYVQTEEKRALRQVREQQESSSQTRKRLFGTLVVGRRAAPARAAKKAPRRAKAKGKSVRPSSTQPKSQESVVFLVRPHRGSQIQVPKQLRTSDFMEPALAVKSVHDEQMRSILMSTSSGNFNYFYFEAPEVRGIASGQSVLRLHWQEDALWYEVFDAATQPGADMLKTLVAGRSQNPPVTFDSKPGQQGTQSWMFLP